MLARVRRSSPGSRAASGARSGSRPLPRGDGRRGAARERPLRRPRGLHRRTPSGAGPEAVDAMLDEYFADGVPAVRREGGEVEADRRRDHGRLQRTRRPARPRRARGPRRRSPSRKRPAGSRREHPDWPRFRVGVNTGDAHVGVVGAAGGREYTALGDAVNLASRLEGQARRRPGRRRRRDVRRASGRHRRRVAGRPPREGEGGAGRRVRRPRATRRSARLATGRTAARVWSASTRNPRAIVAEASPGAPSSRPSDRVATAPRKKTKTRSAASAPWNRASAAAPEPFASSTIRPNAARPPAALTGIPRSRK